MPDGAPSAPVSWVETTSPHFSARHEEHDAEDVVGVLELLEGTRERLAEAFAQLPDHVAVVVHGSPFALSLAQPYLPVIRRLTAPAARRYLVGWFQHDEIHVLAPRVLEARASNVPGSREMNLLAPAALYTQLAIGASSQRLPPPFRPATFVRYVRWAWLAAGAAQYFSGQTAFARPAIARRLREGRRAGVPARHPRRPAARRHAGRPDRPRGRARWPPRGWPSSCTRRARAGARRRVRRPPAGAHRAHLARPPGEDRRRSAAR